MEEVEEEEEEEEEEEVLINNVVSATWRVKQMYPGSFKKLHWFSSCKEIIVSLSANVLAAQPDYVYVDSKHKFLLFWPIKV